MFFCHSTTTSSQETRYLIEFFTSETKRSEWRISNSRFTFSLLIIFIVSAASFFTVMGTSFCGRVRKLPRWNCRSEYPRLSSYSLNSSPNWGNFVCLPTLSGHEPIPSALLAWHNSNMWNYEFEWLSGECEKFHFSAFGKFFFPSYLPFSANFVCPKEIVSTFVSGVLIEPARNGIQHPRRVKKGKKK